MKNTKDQTGKDGLLADSVAQALWAAMHQDDELASYYANAAIVWALQFLQEHGFDQDLNQSDRVVFEIQLRKAKTMVYEEHDDWASRWRDYNRMPF